MRLTPLAKVFITVVILASVGLLAALLFACLIEWWVAGGTRHGWH